MEVNLLLLFIVLNILNVIIQTIKSLATIKCGKLVAAVVNAIAYGLYTIVLVYTMCDLPLYAKALVVALCNLIGVYIVKSMEEKVRKEKLWEIKVFIPKDKIKEETLLREKKEVPMNYIDVNVGYIVNFYCSTKRQSSLAKHFANEYNAKYFITESE